MTDFVKMEGLGNDFILIEGPRELQPTEVKALSDRRRGIGADGVLVVHGGSTDSVRLEVFNADGSEAELSGNGLRCAARYAIDRGWGDPAHLTMETQAGSHRVERLAENSYRVELGEVTVEGTREIAGRTVHAASIGNPHAVVLVSDPSHEDVAVTGPEIAAAFQSGANVGFAAVPQSDHLQLRVWERGVGETLACGTGAAAAHAVALTAGLIEPRATASLNGGDLTVETIDDTSWITGPAHYVFEGTWERR